jgi:hypothetical protein
MRGFRSLILDGKDVGAAVLPTVILLAFTAGFMAVSLARFSFEETKSHWA